MQVISYCQHNQYVAQRVKMDWEMPKPTPRTKASVYGMRMWEKFVEAEREQQQLDSEHYKKPYERFPQMVVGAWLAFDHIIWEKYPESYGLCYYVPRDLKAYTMGEIPMDEPTSKVQKKDELVKDVQVYGS